MNYEILKNQSRDRLVDALIVGSSVVRWVLHQVGEPETPPLQAANIEYYKSPTYQQAEFEVTE